MIDAILANSVLPTVHENFPTQVVELGWLLSVCILTMRLDNLIIAWIYEVIYKLLENFKPYETFCCNDFFNPWR